MEIKAFHELEQLGKTPIVAKIGGFRPDPAKTQLVCRSFLHPPRSRLASRSRWCHDSDLTNLFT